MVLVVFAAAILVHESLEDCGIIGHRAVRYFKCNILRCKFPYIVLWRLKRTGTYTLSACKMSKCYVLHILTSSRDNRCMLCRGKTQVHKQ